MKPVHVDQRRPLAGAGARLPRARQCDIKDVVELADMAERERAQNVPSIEGATRRV
ncbi:MAG: hypothetical protein ACR2ND_06370 [Solirubrobacteraceae bacterium]